MKKCEKLGLTGGSSQSNAGSTLFVFDPSKV